MTMMECPRCHFAQPTDQYCAKCGLNIETFVAQPKPFWVRVLQNPNFHLSLIGVLIVVVVGWIFFSQAGLVKREVGHLLDLPLSSRDAADPNEPDNSHPNDDFQSSAQEAMSADSSSEPNATTASGEAVPGEPSEGVAATPALGGAVAGPPIPAAGGAGAASSAAQKLEVSYWEIPRELFNPVLAQALRVGRGPGGKTYFWQQNTKLNEILQSGAQSLAAARTIALQAGGQVIVETPPTAPEMFQFGLMVQLVKVDGKDVTMRWDASLVLPQPEPAGQTRPAVRQIAESSQSGTSPLTTQNAIAIVFEPTNRTPRDEYLSKVGDGPWNIFSSPEFRAGLTDWVIVVELK